MDSSSLDQLKIKKEILVNKRKFLLQKELKKLRSVAHEKQFGVCPILNQRIPVEDMVVDHKHRTKSTTIGKDDCGIIRGVIQRQANVIEGKISNSFVRYGLGKFNISIPDFLRNLAEYLENPPLLKLNLIHPNEKPKAKKLKKLSYNKLKKMYTGKHMFPSYPASGKLTVPLQKLYKEYKLTPEFYK